MPYLDRSDWTAKVTEAGLTPERTEAEWVNHPTALDDLMRVMGGTHMLTINAERKRRRDIDAA